MAKRLTDLNRKQAEWLLAAVIVARATAYMFSQIILQSMGLFNLLAVRFLFAFAILVVLFRGRLRAMDRRTLLCGAALGGAFFLVMTAEMGALLFTTTSTVSFLENTAIIIVPLMTAALAKRLPKGSAVASAAVALAGVGLLTLQNGLAGFSAGHLIALAAAFLYAATIILTDRFSHTADAMVLGVLQIGVMGALSLIASFLLESPRMPAGLTEWAPMVVLIVVCTIFGFTLQPVAQSKTSAEKAGVFCALNPAASAVLGTVFLHEYLGVSGLAGAALILLSIFIPQLWEKRLQKRLRKRSRKKEAGPHSRISAFPG